MNNNGMISGGVLQATGGAFAWNGGTLDGLSYEGTLDLSATGSLIYAMDGLIVTGSADSGPGTINLTGQGSELSFVGAQTIDNATINIGNASAAASLNYVIRLTPVDT